MQEKGCRTNAVIATAFLCLDMLSSCLAITLIVMSQTTPMTFTVFNVIGSYAYKLQLITFSIIPVRSTFVTTA